MSVKEQHCYASWHKWGENLNVFDPLVVMWLGIWQMTGMTQKDTRMHRPTCTRGPTQSVGHRHSCICHPSSLLLLITSSLSLDAGFVSIWPSFCPLSRLSQGLLWGHMTVWCNLYIGESIGLTNAAWDIFTLVHFWSEFYREFNLNEIEMKANFTN